MTDFEFRSWGRADDPPVVIIGSPADGIDWPACAEVLAGAGRHVRVGMSDSGAWPPLQALLQGAAGRLVLICSGRAVSDAIAALADIDPSPVAGLVLIDPEALPAPISRLRAPVLVIGEENANPGDAAGIERIARGALIGEGDDHAEALAAVLLGFLERCAPRQAVHYEAGSDARLLRDAMGCFATGVTIVTTRERDGRPVGLTANSFTSVSLDPPLILFCLAKTSASLEAFRTAEHFAVNVLHIGQQPTSGVFARASADRFEGVEWETWTSGAPILSNSLGSFECQAHQVVDAGDHLVFIGRVTRARFEPERDPLLYFRGKYRRLHFS